MTRDQLVVVAVAGLASVVVGALGLLAGRLVRRRSLAWQLGLVAAVAVGSQLAGTLAIARLMFLSRHDLAVVTLVTAAAAVGAMVVALLLGQMLVRWSLALTEQVRGVDPALPEPPTAAGSPAEFRALSRELAATRERLTEARAREQRAEESRRELVSWVSHDLRTPLAAIRALTEALEDGLAPDPARYLAQVRAEVDRMVGMVEDLFELSRIHAGVLRLDPMRVGVEDLVSGALAGAEAVAVARGVRLTGRAPAGLEAEVDAAALDRVLGNLLANAVRHTPPGGEVEVVGEPGPAGVRLSVRDACGGIPDADRDRLFDVGWRGSTARTPEPPVDAAPGTPGGEGAGLGLAIVRGLVEAHRGTVVVEEAPGGCRFVVDLPVV